MRSFKRLTQQLILADTYRRDTVFASLLMTWKSLKKVCGVEKSTEAQWCNRTGSIK